MAERRVIRVLCVDDHAFLVEGLRARMAIEPDLEVVGRLPSADTLVRAAEQLRPDIVLLDIEMPGVDAFTALEDLRHVLPEVRTIILSAHVRDHYLDMAAQAGAWGYFSKSDSPEAILDGVRRVHRGEFALGPEVSKRQRSSPPRRSGDDGQTRAASRLEALSPRELEVLRLIGRGLTRSEIAQTLHRSPKTVDAHREAIMRKLDIHDRAALVRFAIREGI
ncbi:MAG: DNA-binding response regulator, partial [Planctomycetota bacterium]